MKATEMKLWDNNGKSGLDGVGWIQVWINGEKKLTQGSDHTGAEVQVDSGSKRILAVHVSCLVTSTNFKGTRPRT
jgi:hypothetical protein